MFLVISPPSFIGLK